MIGGSVAVIGLLIRGWASGHIRKNQQLAVSGPYSHTRNPLYFGSFLLTLGFTMAAGSWILAIVFIVFFLIVYLPVMKDETGELEKIFGEEFIQYEKAVPLFIPRLLPFYLNGRKPVSFDFALYLRYREYRAALGLVFALSVLTAKAIWLN